MAEWKNLDKLDSYKALMASEHRVDLRDALSGDKGASRVRDYSVPMGCGLIYNFASKQVDDEVLSMLADLAKESELEGKFKELYNGAMINTGEKRLVLHHLTRGQLGDPVIADGVDKRAFYTGEQAKIAEFASKVHSGEVCNADGDKFNTVVQIGIGGSDLGPRAMYIALENWARPRGRLLMEARFISNVDPDDAVRVLDTI
ncbi:MAG: glucose-6-phosphate isomerase, partial [Clostridiales bacterium]|nr:glucose-6-phosphate isomerase [Clostridiales bacterium]